MTDDSTPGPSLTNVHQALNAASLASANEQTMKNFSVRLPPNVKEKAQAICERHGTDLSTFLRECCVGLLKDFGHPAE